MSSVPPAGGQLFAGSLGPAGHSLSDVLVAKLRGQQQHDHVTGDRVGAMPETQGGGAKRSTRCTASKLNYKMLTTTKPCAVAAATTTTT